MDALAKFYSLCSQIQEPSLRMGFERWAARHVRTYAVTAAVDLRSEHSEAIAYEQKRTLSQMIRGVVDSSAKEEREAWMQGDRRMGVILTRKLNILAEDEEES